MPLVYSLRPAGAKQARTAQASNIWQTFGRLLPVGSTPDWKKGRLGKSLRRALAICANGWVRAAEGV